MEKYDSLYFRIRRVVPYLAKNLAEYLETRDEVEHRRNGILVGVPNVTLEIIPEEITMEGVLRNAPPETLREQGIDPEADYKIIGYSHGRVFDRMLKRSEDVFVTNHFYQDFVHPYMSDINNPETVMVRTVSTALLQYRKSAEFSVLHAALDFSGGEEKPKIRLSDFLIGPWHKPQTVRNSL